MGFPSLYSVLGGVENPRLEDRGSSGVNALMHIPAANTMLAQEKTVH